MSVEHRSLFGMQFKRRLVLLRKINLVSVDISLFLSPQGHETFKRLNALAPWPEFTLRYLLGNRFQPNVDMENEYIKTRDLKFLLIIGPLQK